jgi:hypothetical protein
MTESTIHNFTYFLTELEKNIKTIEKSMEQERIALQSMLILHSTMHKMCKNWINKEKFKN